MPLMGSLYIGSSGLQTSQNALNTVTHNLANIDTVGYTRQQTVQGDKRYTTVGRAYISSQQSGLGVTYEKVRQVRDAFLDKSYRKEAGRSAYYDKSYEAANEITTLFGELEGVQFQESLSDLWSAVQELAKDPTNATNQGMIVSVAEEFVERARAIYEGFAELQDNYNSQILDQVDLINKYGEAIQELNIKIQGIEAGKISGKNVEEANDLRDARNQLLDELSSMVSISYYEDIYGAVNVQIEGTDFVSRTYVNPMGVTTDPDTGFHTPVWIRHDDEPVFNLTREISTELDTDIGGMKALMVIRGEHRGNYLDIPQEKDPTTWWTEDAGGMRMPATTYEEACGYYDRHTGKSLLQNTMAEFDTLIHEIATGFNEILNARTDNGDGTSSVSGIDLFIRSDVDTNYKQTTVQNEQVTYDGSKDGTLYSIANIMVNPLLLQNYTYLGSTLKDNGEYTLGFMTKDDRENVEMANKLVDLFTANDQIALNPTISTKLDLKNYYTNLIGDVGEKGFVFKGVSEGLNTTVMSLEASRQEVAGVSDSEELNNMIMFQNAYNASSRYINVINTLLETLLNMG